MTPARLRERWRREIEERGRSAKTGRTYLDALGALSSYAIDLDSTGESPLASFREWLQRKRHAKH